jgi:hypothetical protein
METIQNVIHDDTGPKARNRMLQKKCLNLSINKVVMNGEEKQQQDTSYL